MTIPCQSVRRFRWGEYAASRPMTVPIAAAPTTEPAPATGTVLAGEDDEEDSSSEEDDDTLGTASTATGAMATDADIDDREPNQRGLALMTASLNSHLAPVLQNLSARLVELQQRQIVRVRLWLPSCQRRLTDKLVSHLGLQSIMDSIQSDKTILEEVRNHPELASISQKCNAYKVCSRLAADVACCRTLTAPSVSQLKIARIQELMASTTAQVCRCRCCDGTCAHPQRDGWRRVCTTGRGDPTRDCSHAHSHEGGRGGRACRAAAVQAVGHGVGCKAVTVAPEGEGRAGGGRVDLGAMQQQREGTKHQSTRACSSHSPCYTAANAGRAPSTTPAAGAPD